MSKCTKRCARTFGLCLPAGLREEHELLLSQLAGLGVGPVAGCGGLTPRQLHLGEQQLFAPGKGQSVRQDKARAARTGETVGTKRLPSNFFITIEHLREPMSSWLGARRAQAGTVSKRGPQGSPSAGSSLASAAWATYTETVAS